MLVSRLAMVSSLSLLIALLLSAGPAVAGEEVCLEEPCEIVIDPIDCFQGSEKVLHVDAKQVVLEVHYACSNGDEVAASPAGCDPYPSPTATDVEIGDACYRVEVFPNSACVGGGGWEATYGIEDVQVTLRGCDLPVEPATAQGSSGPSEDLCEDWSHGVADALPGPIAIQDDGCLVMVQDPPYQCVGPWGTSVEGNVGPVGYDWYVCGPPGGTPIDIA